MKKRTQIKFNDHLESEFWKNLGQSNNKIGSIAHGKFKIKPSDKIVSDLSFSQL